MPSVEVSSKPGKTWTARSLAAARIAATPAHVIVVGHREHGDPQRHRLLHQSSGVRRVVRRRWRPAAVRAGVVARIHLQGAPAELGARRLAERDRDGIVPAHASPPAAGRSVHPRGQAAPTSVVIEHAGARLPVDALDFTIP